ncbi:hypothetical protein ACHWQZ_G012736 [Mnemiopsis leidyi]
MHVANSVLNSANSVFKLNAARNDDMLIKMPNSNVLKSDDSTISNNNDDLCLDSDQWCCDINVTDVSKPYVEVRINGKLLSMEFDSGSSVSVVSRRTLSSCGLSNLKLTPSRKTLRVANGQIKAVEGCAVVNVELKGEKAHDMLLYVAEDFPSLFGRPWIEKFCGENWLDELLNTRLPKTVVHSTKGNDEIADMFALTMSETLLNAELVASETKKDPILSKVLEYTLNGWPKNLKCEGDLKAFWSRRDELSHELGCLTWGARVVIPVKLRSTVMAILHSTHIGVSGIPICLVTDNGPQFVLDETENYLKSCGIKHVTVPTYSPKSNGICERLVQSFKTALKKMSESCKDVSKNLYDFLLTYRNTPHSSTGQTPAVLAFNRTLRSALHQIQPADRLRKQELQSDKLQDVIDEHSKTREFHENQQVLVKMDDKSHWQQAKVVRRYGDNSNNYLIQHENRLVKKHADVIKPRYVPVISMKKDGIPEQQKARATECLARSNLKVQKLHETLERRQLRSKNSGDLEGQNSGQVSPGKTDTPSPVKNLGKLVRGPELVEPADITTLPESRLRPARNAKTEAIIKMRSMS